MSIIWVEELPFEDESFNKAARFFRFSRQSVLTSRNQSLHRFSSGWTVTGGQPQYRSQAFSKDTEPIKNPVTGKEHRARIVLPNGFEYKEAEVANAVAFRVTAGNNLDFRHKNSHAHLNAIDWSN